MSERLRAALEIGPKGKKVVALAPDWPGLSRNGKTAEAALNALEAYIPRYAPIVKLAKLGNFPVAGAALEVVEEFPGTPSTDFWGVSFAFNRFDQTPLSDAEFERQLSLLLASWEFFDQVGARVSEHMQKGPRGGGRDRDHIIRHTLWAEIDMSTKVGVKTPVERFQEPGGIAAHRKAFVAAIREYRAEGKMARKWPLPYLIRHACYHVLDHAWEMEDKDLTGADA